VTAPSGTDGLPELWADGRYHDALALLERAIDADPDAGALHAWRALTLVELRLLDDAAHAAARAEALAPQDALVRLVCGDVALQRDDAAEASRHVAWALARDCDDPDALTLGARLHALRGDWREAHAAARLALEHAPEHEGAAVLAALATEQRASVDAAADAWADVAARFPANAVARTRLGWTALHAGDRRTARDTFETALVLDPSDEGAREGLVAAIAAEAPFHGALLRLLHWIAARGTGERLALWTIATGAVLALGLRAHDAWFTRGVAMVGAGGLTVAVLLGWLAAPVLDAAALLAPRGRDLVRGARRVRAALAVATIVAAAASMATLAAVPGEPRLGYAVPLVLTAFAAWLARASTAAARD
jgi:tetratricopeptide (TPR) repeat protein